MKRKKKNIIISVDSKSIKVRKTTPAHLKGSRTHKSKKDYRRGEEIDFD
jgi:hypothetical protein